MGSTAEADRVLEFLGIIPSHLLLHFFLYATGGIVKARNQSGSVDRASRREGMEKKPSFSSFT